MDQFIKWPAASFCTSTDGETAIKVLEQYIQLNGVPKTIRTDKATAFTGRSFRNFCKEHYIKLIYGTPYIHTPTGLVERGVRTLSDQLPMKTKKNAKGVSNYPFFFLEKNTNVINSKVHIPINHN